MFNRVVATVASTVVLILAGAIAIDALVMHVAVLRSDHPLEYREPAMLLQTDLLLRGTNAYSLDNQPVFTNIYGILYHLAAYPIARIFGSTYLVHRAISAVFVWAICAVVFWVLRQQKVAIPFALAGAAMMYGDLAMRASFEPFNVIPLTLLARPDALGLLLMMMSIIVPWRMRFSRWSLAASSGLGILAFLTKPYFVLGLAVVAIHLLLFVSKKKAAIYAATAVIAFIISNALANWVWPCYHADVIVSNMNGSLRLMSHLLAQSKVHLELEGGLVAATLLLATLNFRCRVHWDWTNWRGPLVGADGNIFVVWLVVSAAAIYGSLGWHTGNFLLYFFQLLSPPLVILAFGNMTRKPTWAGTLIMLFVLHDLFFMLIPLPRIPEADARNWQRWEEVTNEAKRVYAPPPLAELLWRQGKQIYNGGLTDSFAHTYPGNIRPSDAALRERQQAYEDEIRRMIQERQFDLIILPYLQNLAFDPIISKTTLETRYRRVQTLPIELGFQKNVEGDVYLPISGAAK